MTGFHFRRFLSKTLIAAGVLLFIGAQAALAAGTGTLQGKVFDKESKQGLPGATVLIKGTSIGASTDLNGAFTVHGVPSGEQTVVVSYVGYNSSTEKIDIPSNETLTKDFFLQGTAVQGKVVVVTAQAEGQMQAINQQLSSDKIVDVVSAAKIQSLPDFNAASAIGRLPGVSVTRSDGEASKVVINGIAPQYNEVAIGNVTLASTGSTQIGITTQNGVPQSNLNQDRSVSLAMITPYMIKAIQVYKTLTPDMNADAIGGYVNMQLQSAPEGFHTDLLWQSGYTSKSNTYGNYRAVASASDRFFDNKLGAFLLFDAESYNRNSDNMSAGYATVGSVIGSNGYYPVQVQSVNLDRHIETRRRYGANLILDYKLPNGVIRSTNMYSRLSSDYQDYQTNIGYNTKNLGFTYQSANNTNDLALNTLEFKNDFGFMSMDLEGANTYSRNYIPSEPIYFFNVTGGVVGSAPINTPPQDLKSLLVYGPGSDSTVYLQSMGLYSTNYYENDQQYKTDFKIPLTVSSDFSGYFKFGGMYRYNYHTNQQNTPYATPHAGLILNTAMMDSLQIFSHLDYQKASGEYQGSLFTNTSPDVIGTFLGNQFGQIYWAPNAGVLNSMVNYLAHTPALSGTPAGGWQYGPFQQLANSYKYIEKYYAGYAMANLRIGPNLMIVGGARFEEDRSLYAAFNMHDSENPQVQPIYPVTVYPQNHYWLPMVQGKYSLTNWMDLRYSYAQTLARPAYTELAPNYTINQYGNSVFAGNPNLTPARAYNQNAEIDFHSNSLGFLSISGFYKTIAHFTYATNYQLFPSLPPNLSGLDTVGTFKQPPASSSMIVYTFTNSPYKAYVSGFTIDYQTRFWYLPAPFDGMVFGVNYSHMTSIATYPYLFVRNIPNPNNPKLASTELVDSTVSGRLVDQPNDLLNAYIGYDYRGFSARLSFLFQGNSVSYIGGQPEQDGFTTNYFRIDAQVRQLLPWTGLQLFLNAQNLNNEANISTQSSINGFTSEDYYGMTIDLGIRYIL